MSDSRIQGLMDAWNSHVRPYVNMGNSRGTFGSFYPSSSGNYQMPGRKKKSGNIGAKARQYLENVGEHPKSGDALQSDLSEETKRKEKAKKDQYRKKKTKNKQQNMQGEAWQEPGSAASQDALRQDQESTGVRKENHPAASKGSSGNTGKQTLCVGGALGPGIEKNPEALRQAVFWAEVLGEPVSVKRRKKRVNQQYGNQGNAHRG